jgi:hypothetical protein
MNDMSSIDDAGKGVPRSCTNGIRVLAFERFFRFIQAMHKGKELYSINA